MKQEQRVLAHFEKKNTITSIEALRLYGIARLASVICELRKKGEKIVSVRADGFNKFGEPTHWTIYQKIKEPKQLEMEIKENAEQ